MKLSLKSAYFASLVLITLCISSCYPAHTGSGSSLSSSGGGGGSTSSFSIGGNVSGLAGSGLVLLDNGGDNLTINANGLFTFRSLIGTGLSYNVTVLTQPSSPAQTCFVVGGNGTASANVTTVQVACSTSSIGGGNIIGGQVTGLLGSGLVLQDNGSDNLPVKANGGFDFATTVANGANYSVTVLQEPTNPTQTCTVSNPSGTASGNVGNIVVTCSAGTLSLGGSVSGLAGTGLVLGNSDGDSVTISGNGSFTFPILLVSGTTYAVSIKTQPTAPAQICAISNNAGTATTDINNIQIVCPAVFHSVGGQIVGLSVPTGQTSNMVIQNNGGDNLNITGNGAFTFVTPIANGSAYDVSTFVPPNTQPGIGCIIWGWDGVAFANVTDVTVDCGHNDWTWMDGADTANQDEQVTPPPIDHTQQDNDTPGGSKYSASWSDSSGRLWLLTGSSHALTKPNITEFFDEMWVYNDANYGGGFGNFWTLVPAAGPVPPARWGAVTWTDASGNFWLFGGQDASLEFLNDLWFYSPGSNAWAQVSGGFNQNGVYGTKGLAGAGNLPGGRWGATGRKDSSGNVWIFGGYGYGDATSANTGLLNDLWKFSGGQWTWVTGSSVLNPDGDYGVEGSAAVANVPGGRQAPVSWVDNSGNFWLFGGYDLSPTGQPNAFNDLWEFSPGLGQWTWVSGSNAVNQTGTYGTQGVAASTNVPGARWSPSAFSDTHRNLWLFGGFGFDATGDGSLADLWEYQLSSGQWIWVKGPNSVSQAGIYGIQPNPVVWPHVINYPGSRWGATSWTDISGKFFMFGGEGFDSTNSGTGDQLLNDLWRYLPYP